MRLRRPSRLPQFSYLGFQRYSLRFTTHRRLHIFVSSESVRAVLTQILRACVEEKFEMLAYCFMPDHVHLLVEGRALQSDLRRLVKVAKQRAAFVGRTTLGVPQLWQEGYYERVLRSADATDVVIRYILHNPVRAGIVARVEDYPFSGAQHWPDALRRS